MVNKRIVSGLLIAGLTASIIFIALKPNLPSYLSLLLSLALGLIIGWFMRGRGNGNRRRQEEADFAPATLIEFPRDLLDATVNEMREGLLVIDAEMRVVASNRAAQNLFALVSESIHLHRLTEITRNPAIYDAFLDALRGTERSGVKVETYGPAKKVFDLRVVPIWAENGQQARGAVGVFFDVTRLERLERVRQEFLSNVSHELRTPLTSIMALAETLEGDAIDDREHSRKFLAIIQKNAVRMSRLIDDILELSAIEAGNVKVLPEEVQLYPLVEDVIASLSASAVARRISVYNLVGSEVEVLADPYRLVQMLTNLIDNAIKFNREGGNVSIKHAGGAADRITVEDTGEGIPAHHLDRLFERFYRVDRARSLELGGTGLGLAIVKHLAKAHGGEVAVESRFGQGTKFTVEIPRRET